MIHPRVFALTGELRTYFESGLIPKETDLYLLLVEVEGLQAQSREESLRLLLPDPQQAAQRLIESLEPIQVQSQGAAVTTLPMDTKIKI